MAELIQVATIVRKLFLPDVVPWPSLLAESNLAKLRLRYKFNDLSAQVGDPAAGGLLQVASSRGEFVTGGIPQLVEHFAVQPTFLQFQINGDSEQADKFAADVGSFFLEIDPHKNYDDAKELTRTYQTIAVVKLSVSFDAIFSDRFNRYLTEEVRSHLAPPNTDIEIRLQNVRWTVSYKPATFDFAYLPKPLSIEPRQGNRPGDRVFYTQSPTDFNTHMNLINALERSFS